MNGIDKLRIELDQPKYELKTKMLESESSLSGIGKGVGTFRNYKPYNETMDVYELRTDDYNAFYGIAFEMKYDYTHNGIIKDIYIDQFKRKVYVSKVK